MEPKSENLIGVTKLLRNVAGEIDRLAQIAERLDRSVGQLAAAQPELGLPLSSDLQEIDALRQALHSVASVTLCAASEISQRDEVWLSRAALSASIKLERVIDACLQSSRDADRQDEASAPKHTASDAIIFFDGM